MIKNEFDLNHEIIKEEAIQFWLNRKGSILFKLLLLIIIINIIVMFIGRVIGIIDVELIINRMILIAILIFILGMDVVRTRKRIKNTVKRMKLLGIENPHIELIFDKEFIRSYNHSTGGNTQIEYKNIYKVVETKRSFILFFKANIIQSVIKDGFTEGSVDDFIELISQLSCKKKLKR